MFVCVYNLGEVNEWCEYNSTGHALQLHGVVFKPANHTRGEWS